MRLTAHRGYGERYPENTVEAARQASRFADAVEIDVRRCGSGELVVSHYDYVRAVADAEGTVDEHSASELASVDVEGSESGVPRLEVVLDAIPASVGVNVELKARDVAEDAAAAVRRGVDGIVASRPL